MDNYCTDEPKSRYTPLLLKVFILPTITILVFRGMTLEGLLAIGSSAHPDLNHTSNFLQALSPTLNNNQEAEGEGEYSQL